MNDVDGVTLGRRQRSYNREQPPDGSELSDLPPPPSFSPLPLSIHEIEVEGTKEEGGEVSRTLGGGANIGDKKRLNPTNTNPPPPPPYFSHL